MKNFFKDKTRQRRIARAAVAGFVGGVAGSAVKLLGEALYPPRTEGQQAPPAVLAEKIVGHSLTKKEKSIVSQAVHWTMGSSLGACYGVVAELWPQASAGCGLIFGVAVLLATHESALPLLKLAKSPTMQPTREHASELVTHLLYGTSVDAVRKLLLSF